MDYSAVLNETRENFYKKRELFSKVELNYVAGKNNLRNRMLGFLTFDYYKRSRLIKSGEIFYGYVFRTYFDSLNEDKPTATWLLFSPTKEFNDNPELYLSINDNIVDFISKGKPKNKLKKLYNLLTPELAEPVYYELPSELADNKLVYLSFTYLRKFQVPAFRPGINLFIAAKNISKEILYLPMDYWVDEYKEYYLPKNIQEQYS